MPCCDVLDKYRADPARDAQRLTSRNRKINATGAWWPNAKARKMPACWSFAGYSKSSA
jgi:hypothetical protein